MFKLVVKTFLLILFCSSIMGCNIYRKVFGGEQEDDYLKSQETEKLSLPDDVKATTQSGSSRNIIPNVDVKDNCCETIMDEEPPGFN